MVNQQNAEHGIFFAIKDSSCVMGAAGRRLADFILTDSRSVIHLTVSELATKAGVSDATVVRFCQELGYRGYQDFKIHLSQALVAPVESLDWTIERDDSPKVLLEKVSANTIETIRNTSDCISEQQLTVAVKLLGQARRIIMFGCGISGMVATDGSHKFMKLGVNSISYSDSHNAMQAISVAGSRDLLFVVSYSGATRDILHAVALANEIGMRTMAITRQGKNPLRDLVDVALSTSSPESFYRVEGMSTRIAQLCIMDALFVGLYLSDEKRFGETLQNTRESVTCLKI